MKVYYNSATEAAPIVINGNPPVDQSALVTQLQGQIVTLTGQRDAALTQVTTLTAANATLQGKIDAARIKAQADKDADAAQVAGQGVLDALS